MNLPTLVIVLVIAVLAGLAVWSLVRKRKHGGACSFGCSGCTQSCNCNHQPAP